MERDPAWRSLLERQHGVFAADQAAAFGLDKAKLMRRRQRGLIDRELPRVYRSCGAPQTWMQRTWAVALWACDRGVLSHHTAGHIMGLALDEPVEWHVATTRSLRAPAPDVVVHRTSTLPQCDVTSLRGLPITTMPRTIIDLAGTLPVRDIDVCLDNAIRRGMPRRLFIERLQTLSARGRDGTALLNRLVEEREAERGLPGSVFERRLLQELKRSGLPLPACQFPVTSEGFTALLDFAYPEFGLAIEADGYRWHDGAGPSSAIVAA